MRKFGNIPRKFFLPPDLVRELDACARRTRLAKSEIVRLAIAAWLSADGRDQLEAAVTRRLDRLARGQERIERDLAFLMEAVALYIRTWLNATPAAPDGAARAAMEAKGRERYARFLEALGRRLAAGRSLRQDVRDDRSGEGDAESPGDGPSE